MRKASPQLLELLSSRLPGVAQLALELRKLVLREVPEAEEVLYSVYAEVIVFKLPGRPGGAFCSVAAYSRHVNLFFLRGAEMPDPHRVLTGTGKKIRHIRFDSLDELEHGYFSDYVRTAMEQVPPALQKTTQRKSPKATRKR